jgi:hypothetical protein
MTDTVVYALFSPKWGWMRYENDERWTTPNKEEAEDQLEWGNVAGEGWRIYWWLEQRRGQRGG